jgi:hypothetical protein
LAKPDQRKFEQKEKFEAEKVRLSEEKALGRSHNLPAAADDEIK